MHTPSIYLATLAVLATIASAEGERPKFYFPRQVKRQIFVNTTAAPEKSKQDPFSSFSTKRSLTDFLSGLTTGDTSSPSSAATTENTSDSVLSPVLPTSSAEHVTTIHFQTTKFVEPTTGDKTSVQPTSRDIDISDVLDPLVGSTGVVPLVTVQPTTTDAPDSTETTASTDTGSAITFGPDGIVTSEAPTSSDSSSESGVTDGITGPGTASTTASPTSTDEGLLPGLGTFLSTLFDPTTTAPPSSATDAPATETSASDEPGTTNALSSFLGSLSLSDLLPTPTTSGLTGPGTAGTTTTVDPVPTTTPAPSDPLGSILSSILDPITSGSDIVTIVTPTLPPIITTSATDVVPIETPTIPPIITTTPTGSDTVIIVTPTPPPIITTTAPPGNGTDPSVTPTGTPPPPDPTGTDTPGNGTTSETIITPIITPTGLPPANGTETTLPTPPTATPPTTTPSTVLPPPTSTDGTQADPTITSVSGSTAPPTTTEAPSQAPSSIVPTGTDSGTSMWIPSSIMIASSASLPPGVSATAEPTGIPSALPRVISSPNGTDTQPEGTTLIQLGFVFSLNWGFVAQHSMTANQIFKYLPIGLQEGLSLKPEQVVVSSLQPLDTSAQLNYVTTLAMVYIPENMVDTLSLDLHAPLSSIYTNTDSSVNQLMNYINPAIPLQPGSQLAGSAATGTGSGSSPTGNSAGNNGIFDNSSQQTTPKVRSTTVGIAVSCVGAAAAYGAAMFFIARRYKRKKQNHRRSSSVISNSEMRQSGTPALLGGVNSMTGGRTSPGDYSYGTNNNRNSGGSRGSAPNSARTQQISGPMMAENSLGWN